MEHMEWSRHKIFLLINLYRNRPILWDPQSPQHYNKIEKQDAWQDISDKLDTSANECKRKMSSLLASFRREKARMSKTEDTRASASKPYKSGWFAFKALTFILDRDCDRYQEYQPPPPQSTGDPLESDDEIEENAVEEVYTPRYEKDKSYEPNRSTKASKFDASRPPRKKIKASSTDEMVSSAYKILQQAAQKQDAPVKPVIDEFESFGLFVSNKLKNYSRSTRNIVQHHISNILFNADQGQYDIATERVMSKFECDYEPLDPNRPISPAVSSPSPETP